MPKLPGLFDSFDNLDQIDSTSLISWIKPAPSSIQLENYLANKILYPQTLPVSEIDMKIDLAILREALKMNGPKPQDSGGPMLGDNSFLNFALKKIIIPKRFLLFVPDLTALTWAFVDGLLFNRRKRDLFEDLWTVVVSDDSEEIVGSVILPQFNSGSDTMDLSVLDRDFGKSPPAVYKIKAGSLTIIPCPKDRCEIAYKFSNGKIFGKKESALEVYGGRLGLMIDGRT